MDLHAEIDTFTGQNRPDWAYYLQTYAPTDPNLSSTNEPGREKMTDSAPFKNGMTWLKKS